MVSGSNPYTFVTAKVWILDLRVGSVARRSGSDSAHPSIRLVSTRFHRLNSYELSRTRTPRSHLMMALVEVFSGLSAWPKRNCVLSTRRMAVGVQPAR